MNNNQDKYDELENIIDTLKMIVKETTDEHYKQVFKDIIDEVANDMDKIADELMQEHYMEYINSVFEYEKYV